MLHLAFFEFLAKSGIHLFILPVLKSHCKLKLHNMLSLNALYDLQWPICDVVLGVGLLED